VRPGWRAFQADVSYLEGLERKAILIVHPRAWSSTPRVRELAAATSRIELFAMSEDRSSF